MSHRALSCQWIDGSPTAPIFCGAKTAGRSSYCATHHGLVYLPRDAAEVRWSDRLLRSSMRQVSERQVRSTGNNLREHLAPQGEDASPSAMTPERTAAIAADGTRRVPRHDGTD